MPAAMKYRNLDLLKHEIRLLQLSPSTLSDDASAFQCSIQYASLSDPPPYTALSYRWVDGKDTVPISVDNHAVPVTRSLEAALRNLCARGSFFCLVWADAICINQDDLQERGEQINHMSMIYQCAKVVVAWLGEDIEIQERAFPMLKSIQQARAKRSRGGESLKFFDRYDAPSWHAMRNFFENPYWRRLWIIQELAFAEDVQLICGVKDTPLSYLIKATKTIEEYKLKNDLLHCPSFVHVVQVLHIRSMVQAGEPIRLLQAMIQSSRADCSEPRDRVYGLFGLAFDRSRFIPVPSYTLSISDINYRITQRALKSSFSVLAIYGNSSGRCDEPTWIPNWLSGDIWERKRGAESLYLPHEEGVWRSKRGCKCWLQEDDPFPPPKAHGATSPWLLIEGKVLKTRGLLLGKIMSLSTRFEMDSPTPSTSQPSFPASPGRLGRDQGALQELPASSDHRCKLFGALYYLFTFICPDCSTCSSMPDRRAGSRVRYARLGAQLGEFAINRAPPLLLTWLKQNNILNFLGRYFDKGGHSTEAFSRRSWLAAFVIDCTVNQETALFKRLERTIGMGMRLASYHDNLDWMDNTLAWVDPLSQPGDQICILQGCPVPIVLRPRAAGGWLIVGDAIVAGGMEGEYMRQSDQCQQLQIY